MSEKEKELHRILTVSEITKVQGFWTKHRMEMNNVQTGHKTIIMMKNPKYDMKLDAAMFTVSKLEKGL